MLTIIHMRSKVVMFLIFKFKRFISLRIRRAKAVPGCDDKKVTHLGKKIVPLFKRVSEFKKRNRREQTSLYGRQGGIKANSKIILSVPVQTTNG